MRRQTVGAVVLAVALHACSHPAAPAPSPSPAASVSAAPAAAGGSKMSIAVSSRRNGSKFILLTVRKHDRLSYILRADSETGRYFGEDSGLSSFVNPHITFYAPDGKRIVADAPAGTVVEKDKSVVMSGGVHARMADGVTMTSDTMRYDDRAQSAHGSGNVVVTSPQGETLRGDTVDWNLRDGNIAVAGAR